MTHLLLQVLSLANTTQDGHSQVRHPVPYEITQYLLVHGVSINLRKYKCCLINTHKVEVSKFRQDCPYTDHNFCRMAIIIKSNSWLALLGISTSNEMLLKKLTNE